MRTIITLLSLIFWCVSCQETNKQQKPKSLKKEYIFALHDSLEKKSDALPVDFDTLYALAKQILTLADNYPDKDTLIFSEIYQDCALILRLHCDCEGQQPLLCCRDTSLIINSYKNAIKVHYFDNDTLSNSFSSALYQLADVYEQLEQPFLSLPLRQQYLVVSEKTEGTISEMTADAYMFLGGTYEELKNYESANEMYLTELKIREELGSAHLIDVKERIKNFQRKYNIQH